MTRPARRTRSYTNTLREEHAQQTRARIVETAVELMKEGSPESLSVPKLAERSRISTATIYRYFPNRESLIQGVHAWIERALQPPALPKSTAELADLVAPVFAYFERSYDLFRAFATVEPLLALNERGKTERDARYAALLREHEPSLDPDRARALAAVLRILGSFDGYRLLRERFEIEPAMAAETVDWVFRKLLTELARDHGIGERGARTRSSTNGRSRRTRKPGPRE